MSATAEILAAGKTAMGYGHRWEVTGEHGSVAFEQMGPWLALFDQYGDLTGQLAAADREPIVQAVNADDDQHVYDLLAGIYRRELAASRQATVPTTTDAAPACRRCGSTEVLKTLVSPVALTECRDGCKGQVAR